MIKIVTDSGVSLPPSIIQEHDIRIVPATLQWGSEMIRDDKLSAAEFYKRLEAEPAPPIGRDPLPKDFTDIYQQLFDQRESVAQKVQILSLHVSDSLATTLTMSRNAARAMGAHANDIRAFDTRSTSAGQGLIVHQAAMLAKQGKDIWQIEEILETWSLRHKFFTLVNTLDYLAKGGRIGTIAHRVGTFLNVKPILKVENGMVTQHGQQRSRERGIQAIRQLILDDVKGKKHIHLHVCHAASEPDAQTLAADLRTQLDPETCLFSDISPAVGTHTGPGAVGIAWYAE